MKTIAFEDQEYEPFALVLHLICQFPDVGRKRDPRIDPLLDKQGLIKQQLLSAIEKNLAAFKVAVKDVINPKSQELDWCESTNLLTHLLCAQRKFRGIKRFGLTKSSARFQVLMRQAAINAVDGGSAPGPIVLDQGEPASVVTQTDEFSLLVSCLKNNPNKERARLDDLIDALKSMKGNMLSLESIVRGKQAIVSDNPYEKNSLMEFLINELENLEHCYGKEAVTLLLVQLPRMVFFDIKEHYGDIEIEANDASVVVDMMKKAGSLSDFTTIVLYESFNTANDIYLKTLTKVAGMQLYDAATAFVAATENKDPEALSPLVKQGLDHAYLALLRLTEHRKLGMAWFLKINPESQRMVEARAIIKYWFGANPMNAPLFCREIKKLLQQGRRVEAIRLCAAADRCSFVRALLLSDIAVVELLKGDNNPYIALFSDKIQNDPILKLKSPEALDQVVALAARPKTVKLADLFGLFSVSAGGRSSDAPHSGQEQSPIEVANAFSNKN